MDHLKTEGHCSANCQALGHATSYKVAFFQQIGCLQRPNKVTLGMPESQFLLPALQRCSSRLEGRRDVHTWACATYSRSRRNLACVVPLLAVIQARHTGCSGHAFDRFAKATRPQAGVYQWCFGSTYQMRICFAANSSLNSGP